MRALLLLAAALPLAAQPKLLINAQLQTHSAASGLESQFKALLSAQPQPAWIAYSVPSVRTNSLGCDYVRDGFTQPGVVHLEPPDHAVILYRVQDNQVNRVRALSPDCEIDAGGVPVHWLTDVQPKQSIALLVSLVNDRDRIGDNPINAIAQHSDPAADEALEKFLAPSQPSTLRLRAVSALGSARGRHGFEVLKRLISGDPDERVRERAISGLANGHEPEALDLLISIAKTDKNPQMRRQAVSALARKTGRASIDAITSVIDNDQDPSVKRHAVTVLNQIPDGAGIPLLIQMAKTTQNTDLRKQAMNTLQNSRDPRAAAFFEDVLKK